VLLELRVQNLVVIEEAELRLGPGLTAITGETGAGKTVLALALDLLLGGRPRAGTVRHGVAEAWVEGVFSVGPELLQGDGLADLRDRLPEGEDEVVLARRVSAEGRTRAFVQGRSASAGDLSALGGRLLSFYGQHEHRRLTVASAQLDVLDRFAGAEHLEARRALAVAHRRAGELRRELDALEGRDGAAERDRDLLMFELGEIEELAPSQEERDRLAVERDRLRAVDELGAAAAAAVEAISPEAPEASGVLALLAQAEARAGPAGDMDPELAGLIARLAALRLEAEDLGVELRRYADGLEADPGRLEEVEARLAAYERLERKHGGGVAAVLAHADRCRSRLAALEDSGEEIEHVRGALAGAEGEARDLAGRLSAGRKEAAPRLARRVREELRELAMTDAAFEVRLEPRPETASTGAERVELMIAPNPGTPLAPLRDTASGGELSRVMLALMSVSSGVADGDPATLVFDEVDAGVGGQTARAVGERLRRLAQGRQVLCITHLPQIASLAEGHFRIEKGRGDDGSVRTTVEPLAGDAVVAELCRMLGADTGDAGARRHARELLAAA